MGSNLWKPRRIYREVRKIIFMTQCEKIIEYINTFGSISTMDAFRDLGITRLASRIHDLTNRGYEFDRYYIIKKNRYGEPVRYLRYSLKRGTNG